MRFWSMNVAQRENPGTKLSPLVLGIPKLVNVYPRLGPYAEQLWQTRNSCTRATYLRHGRFSLSEMTATGRVGPCLAHMDSGVLLLRLMQLLYYIHRQNLMSIEGGKHSCHVSRPS